MTCNTVDGRTYGDSHLPLLEGTEWEYLLGNGSVISAGIPDPGSGLLDTSSSLLLSMAAFLLPT